MLPGVVGTVSELRGHCKGGGTLQPRSQVCPGWAPSVHSQGVEGSILMWILLLCLSPAWIWPWLCSEPDCNLSVGQGRAVYVPTGNICSAPLLLNVEGWSYGCSASAGLPDVAASVSTHALGCHCSLWLTRIPLCSWCHLAVSSPSQGGPEIWSSPYPHCAQIKSSSASNPE